MLPISIPDPCHEKWSDMSPVDQGAFCVVCSRTVIDFTTLSDEEVRNYLLGQKGQKTCGRFRNDQIISADNPLPGLLASILPFWKKFLAMIVIVFGGFLTGCRNDHSTTGVINTKLGKTYIDSIHPVTQTVSYLMPGEELEITHMSKEQPDQSLCADTPNKFTNNKASLNPG